jgi:hypothetical protein
MSIKSKCKTKIEINDILTVIYWVKSFSTIEDKKFNFQNMLDQAETYQYNNTKFDTDIHPIDELMIEAYKIYHKLKETEDQFSNVLNVVKIPFINPEVIIEQVKNFTNIFEDLIENYHYEDPEIRGIQKGILTEKMKKYVAEEEYELAAKMRDIINED